MIDAASYGLATSNTPTENKDYLSAAIVAADGNTIYVDAGTYAIDPLIIKTDGTHLHFAPGAILQVAPGTALRPAILDIQASHVTIEGGQFDGSGVPGISGIMAIRIYGSHSHIVIRNCIVRNASTGIGSYNAGACEDWRIESCIIEGTVRGHGIYLHGHPKYTADIANVSVTGNTILNTSANGIWVGNGFTDVTITDNQIFNVGRMGIEVWRNPIGRFVIANNIINTCAWMGISIAGTLNTTCSGNIITKVTSYGIEVAGCRNVSLIGNQISVVLSKENGAKPTGITLNSKVDGDLGGISISGGYISDCHSGINVCGDRATRNSIAIAGVIISDCKAGIANVGNLGSRDGGGIVKRLTISGCIIDVENVGIGNSLYGGVMRGAVITGNDIHVSDGNGIDLFRPTDVTIANNRLTGTNAPDSIGIRLRDNAAGNSHAHNLRVNSNAIEGFATPIKTQRIYDSVIE
jgi:hypothetical protein